MFYLAKQENKTLGNKLVQYYEVVEKIGGEEAEFKFSLLTCMPLMFARIADDSEENIAIFEEALEKIQQEYLSE